MSEARASAATPGGPRLELTHFTDPACPFAFSAEPVRLRLRWHYGEQLRWRTCLIVVTRDPGEAERLAHGAPTLQRLYGMPIDPTPLRRPASSEPACRWLIATRLHLPAAEDALMRRLRIRAMLGGLLDDPELLAAAAREAGLDPERVAGWAQEAAVDAALEADVAAARAPAAAARALDDKLGGPRRARRYTSPSYELRHPGTGASVALPGFNPAEALETAIANLAPELERRARPGSVAELLAWAGEPLATAEVALISRLEPTATRVALSRVATAHAAGADFYWTLPG